MRLGSTSKVDLIKGVPLFASASKLELAEIALIAKTPRNATITTTSPVRALVITDRAFRQLLDHAPQIQIGVLTALAERLAPTTL